MADALPAEQLTLNYEEIKVTYSKSGDEKGSLDLTAAPEDGEAGLLLPAVQSAREAARRSSSDDSDQAKDISADGSGNVLMADGAVIFITDSIETGDATSSADSFDFTATPVEQKVGLLLPAVQQVREPSPLPPDEEDQAIDSFKFGPAQDDGETAYEYKLDGVMISSYDVNGAADTDHDRWIDVLSTDWGDAKPTAETVSNAGLRSDGELVQAVSEADMGGDFIL